MAIAVAALYAPATFGFAARVTVTVTGDAIDWPFASVILIVVEPA
jgi:hypothetical protein